MPLAIQLKNPAIPALQWSDDRQDRISGGKILSAVEYRQENQNTD